MFTRRSDVEGEFDMLWLEIKDKELLPFDILDSVPRLLSEKTKKKLIKKTPEEVAGAIKTTIDKINAGSKETIDTLIRKMK